MWYVLEEKQIREIIEKGKFEKDEYAASIAVLGYTAEEIVENYKKRNSMPLIENMKEFYEDLHLVNISDYLFDSLDEEFQDMIDIELEDVKERINNGDIF